METEIRRHTAYVIGRNCYFAGLVIGLVALTLADDPALALEVASVLNCILIIVLLLVAVNAPEHDYRRTEVWALLCDRRPVSLPPEPVVRSLIGTARRDTCMHYARFAGIAAALFLGMGLLWGISHAAIS